LGGYGRDDTSAERKAGASSRTPYVVFYRVKYTRELKKIKENFQKKVSTSLPIRKLGSVSVLN
jgi:hypothetical protein